MDNTKLVNLQKSMNSLQGLANVLKNADAAVVAEVADVGKSLMATYKQTLQRRAVASTATASGAWQDKVDHAEEVVSYHTPVVLWPPPPQLAAQKVYAESTLDAVAKSGDGFVKDYRDRLGQTERAANTTRDSVTAFTKR